MLAAITHGGALRRSQWPVIGADYLVAVVLEAERRSIVADSPSSAPYVGIRVEDPRETGSALYGSLRALGKQPALQQRGYRAGNTYWPVFRRVPAEAGWWQSPEEWGTQLSAALGEAWLELAPLIEEALAQNPLPSAAS